MNTIAYSMNTHPCEHCLIGFLLAGVNIRYFLHKNPANSVLVYNSHATDCFYCKEV